MHSIPSVETFLTGRDAPNLQGERLQFENFRPLNKISGLDVHLYLIQGMAFACFDGDFSGTILCTYNNYSTYVFHFVLITLFCLI